MTLTIVLLIILTGLAAYIAIQVTSVRQILQRGIEVRTITEHGEAPPVLHVELLNPLQVARSESSVGGVLAKMSPGLIQRHVAQRVAEELMAGFRERGIEARISIDIYK
ncbi:hypothetical protein AAIA72_16440 [Hahella sp. SMD15-11]|uniref:Uncharacterized protein n=1 Tax=Thermohahella caldifontis TaxID=3142973 RepID=A0AB39UWK6_9GAMM